MMGHKEKLICFEEDETVCRDMYHRHRFHQIKKSMSRRNRRKVKQDLKCG